MKKFFVLLVALALVSTASLGLADTQDNNCYTGRIEFIGKDGLVFQMPNGNTAPLQFLSNISEKRSVLEEALTNKTPIRVCISDEMGTTHRITSAYTIGTN